MTDRTPVSQTTGYVYVLSDYEEHGAEHVHATLDRREVGAILKKCWPHYELERERLTRWLDKPDDELASENVINLSRGWGGVQLHVVRLEP